jgi:WD40 repeat protein
LGRLNGTPWDLVVSKNGQYVAAAASTGDVITWDMSGRQVQRYSRPVGIYQALRFSADSSMLAACGRDGRLVVWSVQTGAKVLESACDGLANIDYEFSGDGAYLIVGFRSGTIDQVHFSDSNAASSKESIPITSGPITEIVPGHDTSVFVGTDTGELLLYDITTMKVTWRSQFAAGIVRAIYPRAQRTTQFVYGHFHWPPFSR